MKRGKMPTWDKDKMRVWMRERRKQRKAQGLCVRCGSYPAIENQTWCEKCRDYMKNYHKRAKTVDNLLDTRKDI